MYMDYSMPETFHFIFQKKLQVFVHSRWWNPTSNEVLLTGYYQCFIFSRNISYVTPEINYFYYLRKYFPDQIIQKNILFDFEKRSTGYYDPNTISLH